MVKDVQWALDRQEVNYPRRPLSTPTLAAGLEARMKAVALAGPVSCAANSRGDLHIT